jgi:hypothetical protein
MLYCAENRGRSFCGRQAFWFAGRLPWPGPFVRSQCSMSSFRVLVSRLITAVTTSITPVRPTSKRILLTIGKGDGVSGEFRVLASRCR